MNVIHQMEGVIRMQFVRTQLDQEHVHVRMDTLEMELRVQVGVYTSIVGNSQD